MYFLDGIIKSFVLELENRTEKPEDATHVNLSDLCVDKDYNEYPESRWIKIDDGLIYKFDSDDGWIGHYECLDVRNLYQIE